jgi:hypothetical protein
MSDFQDLDTNEPVEETPPPEGGSNRTFIIAIGILGGIFLIVLVAMAVFALVVLPNNQRRATQEANAVIAGNTATVAALTQVAAQGLTTTAQAKAPFPATNTPKPSPTPVLVQPTASPTAVIVSTIDPRTATVSALLTQAALTQKTATVLPTSTALPTTGFADEVGIPGMFAAAVVLIGVILLARRLRISANG